GLPGPVAAPPGGGSTSRFRRTKTVRPGWDPRSHTRCGGIPDARRRRPVSHSDRCPERSPGRNRAARDRRPHRRRPVPGPATPRRVARAEAAGGFGRGPTPCAPGVVEDRHEHPHRQRTPAHRPRPPQAPGDHPGIRGRGADIQARTPKRTPTTPDPAPQPADLVERAREQEPGLVADGIAARRADALMALVTGRTEDGKVVERGQAEIVVHIDASTRTARLDNGPALAPTTAQRLACDAKIQLLLDDRAGNRMYLGRS